MMPKKISTMFSQEQVVGVKCRVIRLFSGLARVGPAPEATSAPGDAFVSAPRARHVGDNDVAGRPGGARGGTRTDSAQ